MRLYWFLWWDGSCRRSFFSVSIHCHHAWCLICIPGLQSPSQCLHWRNFSILTWCCCLPSKLIHFSCSFISGFSPVNSVCGEHSEKHGEPCITQWCLPTASLRDLCLGSLCRLGSLCWQGPFGLCLEASRGCWCTMVAPHSCWEELQWVCLLK